MCGVHVPKFRCINIQKLFLLQVLFLIFSCINFFQKLSSVSSLSFSALKAISFMIHGDLTVSKEATYKFEFWSSLKA